MSGGIIIGKKQDGSVYFQKYRWWAERGMIHWENVDTEAYGSQSVRVTLQRLKSLNDMVKNDLYAAETEAQHASYIERMVDICREAQQQGAPENPDVGKAMRRRRGRSTVVVPTARTHSF